MQEVLNYPRDESDKVFFVKQNVHGASFDRHLIQSDPHSLDRGARLEQTIRNRVGVQASQELLGARKLRMPLLSGIGLDVDNIPWSVFEGRPLDSELVRDERRVGGQPSEEAFLIGYASVP